MMRFDFLELIVRMTQLLYKSELAEGPMSPREGEKSAKDAKGKKAKVPKVHKISITTAINRLFREYIDPAGFEEADTNEFRLNDLYTFKVNQFFERNLTVFQKLMGDYMSAGRNVIKPEEAIYLVQQIAGLPYITERQIQRMYGMSKQHTVDLLKTPGAPKEMVFVEFLEFFARVAAVAGGGHAAYSELPLYQKLDALLARVCKAKHISRTPQMMYLPASQQGILADIAALKKEEQNTNLKKESGTVVGTTDSAPVLKEQPSGPAPESAEKKSHEESSFLQGDSLS